MTTKVSVLMPIYRTQESYLRTAIESILNQTYWDYEFLILDDCPEDDREDIVKSYNDPRIVYMRNDKNLGITQSRNKLIELAKGDYLATMDHDDISLPTRFEKQVAYLDTHPTVGVVGCRAETFPNYIDLYHPETDEDIKAGLTCRCAILHPASMIRKSVLIDNNIRYEERYSPAEDYRLWLRLMDCTDFYNIQEMLFRYRHHTHNTTNRQIDRMLYASEELHYLAQKEHPELLYHFLNNSKAHKAIYVFKKIPLLSFVRKYRKLSFSLFNNIPFLSFSVIDEFDKNLKKHIPLKKVLKKIKQKDASEKNFDAFRILSDIISYQKESEATEVWFCHGLGGGADIYFKEQIKNKKQSTLYIEIQDFDVKDSLKISYFYKEFSGSLICNYKNAEAFLNQIAPQKIVVNNLAFYYRLENALKLITRLKKNLNCFVSFRGHDFQAICPNIFMINNERKYCHCTHFDDCTNCLKKIKNPSMKIRSIQKYRNLWQTFLYNVADEVILFSQSTADMYKKFYPELDNKIKIIPHVIPPLEKIKIEEHDGINIGVLGKLCVEKGLDIVEEMDNLASQYSNIKIFVIGQSKKNFKNIKILGKYDRHQLPDIMRKNKIDIVFISSIIPETFSYTTAETISMGIPIACFDLGAQAEFVKKYSKGLIIEQIDAKYALEKIIHFIENNKKM